MAGMITEAMAQQRKEVAETMRQDKEIPLCININDGRLVPNVKAIRENVNYRPYMGPLNATVPQRMALISQSVGGRTRVIATAPILDMNTFDVSKATREELVTFAQDEYAVELEPDTHLTTLRRQVKDLADQAAQAVDNLA